MTFLEIFIGKFALKERKTLRNKPFIKRELAFPIERLVQTQELKAVLVLAFCNPLISPESLAKTVNLFMAFSEIELHSILPKLIDLSKELKPAEQQALIRAYLRSPLPHLAKGLHVILDLQIAKLPKA